MGSIVSVTRSRKGPVSRLKRFPKLTAPLLRLNGLAPYYTMFPLSFPFDALANSKAGEWVLVPFCGRGTTILAARLAACRLSESTATLSRGPLPPPSYPQVDAGEVMALARRYSRRSPSRPRTRNTARRVLGFVLRPQHPPRYLPHSELPARPLLHTGRGGFRGVTLGILHGPLIKARTYLSNQMPRSYSTKPVPAVRYWQRKNLTPPEVSVLKTISRRARFSFEEVPPSTPGKVVTGDSRTCSFVQIGEMFSWVITLPPYYGMRTYFPDHWLRNWFVGGPSHVDYRAETSCRTTAKTALSPTWLPSGKE